MPNLLLDFAKGLGSAFVPQSLSELKSDADNIKDTLMTGGRTAQEKYREIRNSSSFKKVTDSLFHRSEELGSDNAFDGNDDEFDAGFQFGADETESSSSKILDYDSMKDIAKSQVSSMYEIAGKQTEASAMTTSEIISNMNTRSSEILSSLGNINSSLTNIVSKLDKLIELTTVAKNPGRQSNGPFDMNGNLTFGSVFDFAKGSLQNKYDSMRSMLSIPLSLIQMSKSTGDSNAQAIGMMSGMIASMLFGDKKIFGGKSWDDIQSDIDTKIANAQNNVLTKLLNNSVFKKIFGDHTSRRADQDYGLYVENQYTRDKAVFDGMTRKTIIDIIPGYLRRITAAVTGQTLFISSEGTLTTERPHGFQDMMRRSITDGFTSRQLEAKRVSTGTKVDSKLIYTAQRVLTAQYINYFLRKGQNLIPQDFFENGGDQSINEKVIDLLTQSGGASRDEWTDAVNFITTKMMADKSMRSSYVRKLSGEVQAHDKRLKRYAETATDTHDIGKITEEMVDKAISEYLSKTKGTDMRTYGELKKAGIISEIPVGFKETDRASDEALRIAEREKMKQSEILGSIGNTFKKSTDTTLDYVASIFEILNRGINVFAVNGKQKKKFGQMKVKHISSLDNQQTPTVTVSANTGVVTSTQPEIVTEQTSTNEQTDSDQTPDYFGNVKNILRDPVDKITNAIGTEVTAIGSDISGVAGNTVNTASIEVNRAIVQNELKRADVDQEDRDIANAVLQAMNAAAADGDTKEDLAALSSQISEIKNPKLKSRLSKIVEGTLKRSESKKPASSKLGKILLWGWGIVKTAIGGIISKAKIFFTTLGKTILSPIIKSFKSSGSMVARGSRAIIQGFFGSDESYGIFGRIGRSILNGFKSNNDDDDTSPSRFENVKTKLDQLFKNTKSKSNENKSNVTNQAQTEEEQTSSRKPLFKTPEAITKIGDKFKQTEFGQGFMSAFEDKKEMAPKTLADQSTKGIFDILKSKDGKAGAGETVLSRMLAALTGLKTVFENGVNKLKNGKTASITDTGVAETVSDSIQSSIPTNKSLEPNTSLETTDTPTISATDIADAKSGASGTAAAASKTKGLGFDLGKILGGMSGILLGIGKAILTIVLSMAAVKKIMELFMSVLKASLQPLNKAFQKLYKALKPVMKTVQQVLKQIVEYISQIVEAVIDFIQPLLEAIGPLLEQIMDILNPILKMLTGLIKVLLVPLTSILQTVVVPVLRAIGNALQILLGIVQVGLGMVITGIGALCIATGIIIKWLTGSEGVVDTGKQLFDLGNNMVKSGAENVVSGMKQSITLAAETYGNLLGTNKDKDEDSSESTQSTKIVQPMSLNGSPMDGIVGAGDASSELMDIYGGYGAQSRYGNYLNMSERGCGPVALADAFSRRSGSRVDPRGLASAMSNSGAYNPSAGTSVQGYINASRSMGMNLKPGGVTVGSLRQASPSNPITVIGSGTDYTTRSGNNHYMNVIGSSGGTAFVSNPMTGRVERKSMSSLASSSILGLYGSGDSDVPKLKLKRLYGAGDANAPYKFDDEVTDALSNLKSMVGNIISMFTGGDEIEQQLAEQNKENQKTQLKIDTSGLTEEEQQEIDTNARTLFENSSPRYQDETDAEYEERYQRSKDTYWTKAAAMRVTDKVKAVADGTDEGAVKLIKYTLGEDEENPGFLTGFAESMTAAADDVESGGFQTLMEDLSGGYWDDDEYYDEGFYSDKGARLYTDEYDPTVFENDATGWTSCSVPNTIMGEWMDKMLNGTMMSSPFRWRGRPVDKDAEGRNDGQAHAGVDFTMGGEIPILATTDGEVIDTAAKDRDGYGVFVKVQDDGGDVHLYAHMREDPGPMVEVGDYVYGGDQLGLMGDTGLSFGQHLHYEIRDGDTGEIMNPHSFYHWEEGYYGDGAPYGPLDYEGDLEAGDAWPLYKNQNGVEKFMNTAFDSGLTGPEIAAITSMGIWEDAAEKLWGEKSLLNVTHDIYGQQAKGLMNWVDTSVDYGDTVEEQLQYIQQTYFDAGSKDSRALVSKNGFETQDLAAYKAATGRRNWELDFGDPYGPYMNEEDLIEGSEHWYRTALVPECIHEKSGPQKYIGTAVGVYNWLIDEGWIDPEADSITGLRRYNRTSDSNNSSIVDSSSDWSTASSETYQLFGDTKIDISSTDSATIVSTGDPTPAKWDSGTHGVYNAAGELLADFYEKTGVSSADNIVLNKLKDPITYTRPDGIDVFVGNFSSSISGQRFFELVSDKQSNILNSISKDAPVRTVGNGDVNSTIVQPVYDTAMSSTADVDFTKYGGYTQNPYIVNQYATTRTIGDIDSRLNAVLSNTYNVRSVQIESTLQEMLKLMKEKNQQKKTRQSYKANKNKTPNNQFSGKEIPQQVERLSVG